MSTKILDQEWRAEGCAWIERRDTVTVIAQVKVSGDVYAQAEVTRFIAAAPDMARALMRQGRLGGEDNAVWHTHECWMNGRASCDEGCTSSRAALLKAGVL